MPDSSDSGSEARVVGAIGDSDGVLTEASSLASRAASGAVWVLAVTAGTQAVRLLSNLVLTRLLLQEAFGVMALVMGVRNGLALLAHAGVRLAIIQSPRGDERGFLDTAWTIQVAQGVALFLLGCLMAPLLVTFYGEPRLAWLVPAATFSCVLAGFYSTKLASLSRHLAVRQLGGIDLAAGLCGHATAVLWALVHPSIWALVSGGVMYTAAMLVLSHTAISGSPNRFHWDRSAATAVFVFARWIVLSSLLIYLASRADRFILGKLISFELLGVYSIGFLVANFPTEILSRIGSRIVFPALSEAHNERGDIRSLFRRVRLPLLVLSGWMLSGFIAGGPVIIGILYDDRYAEAGWIVEVLAVGSWFEILQQADTHALNSIGRTRWFAASSLARLAGMLILLPVGFQLGGLPGAVVGLAASRALQFGVSALGASLHGFEPWLQNFGLTSMVGLAALCGLGVRSYARSLDAPEMVVAFAIFMAVSVVWSPLGAAHQRRIRAMLKRSQKS